MNTDKIIAEKIAGEYAPKQTSKVVALKKLDRKAKSGANIFSYSFGIIMTLLLGTGMCLTMGVIGTATVGMNILGIVLGIVGIIGVSVNYLIYKKMLENGKKKYGADIIALANDIVQAED